MRTPVVLLGEDKAATAIRGRRAFEGGRLPHAPGKTILAAR
ncbi:hypothetical protein ABT299_06510 [Spirillospora sp. NPDC000708]